MAAALVQTERKNHRQREFHWILYFRSTGELRKNQKGTYQGSITLRENGRKITEIPTLLIVKEPDYPRVTSVSVEPDNRAGSYVISSYLPGGAENLAFLVYSTDGVFR